MRMQIANDYVRASGWNRDGRAEPSVSLRSVRASVCARVLCVRVSVCMCKSVRVWMWTCLYKYTRVCVRLCVYMHTCVWVCVCNYDVCVRVCVRIKNIPATASSPLLRVGIYTTLVYEWTGTKSTLRPRQLIRVRRPLACVYIISMCVCACLCVGVCVCACLCVGVCRVCVCVYARNRRVFIPCETSQGK